jgi:uncharacterized lipoprotein
MMSRQYSTSALLLMLLAGLNACGWVPSQSEYDPVNPGQSLEVPPDLDTPDTRGALRVPNATYSRVEGGPVSASAPALSADGAASASASASAESGLRMIWEGGIPSLVVEDSEEGTWRRVGFALERMGIDVDSEQRESSTYVVDYVDAEAREQRPGVFSRWILRRKGPTDHSGTYQVKLRAQGESTHVNLLDEDGNPADSVLTEEILQGLMDRLG